MSERPEYAMSSDALASLLETIHLGGSLYFRSELNAPWGMEVPSSAEAQFHVVRRGRCWLLPVDGAFAPQALEAGDMVVLPHGPAHILADEPTTRARPLHQLVNCDLDSPADPHQATPLRIGGAGARTTLICGFFSFDTGSAHPLLDVLPPVLYLRGEGGRARRWLESSLDLIADMAAGDRPGGAALVDRLTEALFIQVLQTYLEEGDDSVPSWLTALRDPQLARALGAIHGDSAAAWTVDGLAARAGMSRSAFSARFRAVVGEPPLHYLTRWRMQLAANHLRDGRRTLAEIAAATGYGAEASFSKTFKRFLGVAPGTYRRMGAEVRAG